MNNNTTAIESSSSSYHGDFMWTIITYIGDTLFLLFLLSGPLIKFAKSRHAVYLICSKCVATTLDLPITIVHIKYYKMPLVQNTLTIIVRFHVLALAFNRAHSVLFPFHYSQMSSKRTILHFCLLTWAISLIIAIVGAAIGLLYQHDAIDTLKLLGQVKDYCNLTVAGLAAAIYVGMSVKLIWAKCFIGENFAAPTTNSHIEKDQMRIFMVCLISVIPFLLTHVRDLQDDGVISDWMEIPVYWFCLITDCLSFVAEEICLILISAHFRRIIGQHIYRCAAIFGGRKKWAATSPAAVAAQMTSTKSMQQQQHRKDNNGHNGGGTNMLALANVEHPARRSIIDGPRI